MFRIAIFASGSGSNAENFIRFFENNQTAEIALIVTNNPNAFVIERAKKFNIPCVVFSKNEFCESEKILLILKQYQIDFIVLAGFLLLVPQYLISKFPNRILNIHPALLPRFSGKGMYGDKVHKAVKDSGETTSGITIHLVNENFDEGQIIFQSIIRVLPSDTEQDIAEKVHKEEYQWFPTITKYYIANITKI
jgi:phosphoribosylglycinamide formyltransferase-1